jgi:glycosyltransferase involved in cell wall biosynthesis
MKQPLVSVIVPTKNSAHFLSDFLESFINSNDKRFEIIINDDVHTNDDTKKVISRFKNKGLPLKYLQKNTSMAQGRKRGAKEAKGNILLHLDSDMQITPNLIGECIARITSGYDALIIPEESFGNSFWAKCKWLEKKCYAGVDEIESLRCLRTSVYRKINGHNESMVFSEDKDLDLRIREAGYKIGRTKHYLRHNEGDLRLLKTLKKKQGYSKTADLFAREHPEAFRWQTKISNRYVLYLKNAKYLVSNPLLYAGMIFMKTCEFGAGGLGLLTKKLKGRAIWPAA